MSDLINVHPGQVLQEEFLEPLSITPYRIAKSIGVQQIQISKITKGEIGISAEMAVRLGKFFGNSAEFWMNLNRNHELRKVRHQKKDIIDKIVSYKKAC